MPVYVIRVGENGPVKIGWSRQPLRRLKNMQTASVEPMRLLGTADGELKTEKELHRQYKHLQLRGEWFTFCPTMMDKITAPVSRRRRDISMERKEAPRFPTADEVAEEARDAGLSIPALCAAADVAPSTFYRWRDGSEISVRVLKQFLDAICVATHEMRDAGS